MTAATACWSIDDVLATGGTARAARDLLTGAGAAISGLAVLLELEALGGRAQLGAVAGLPAAGGLTSRGR